VLAGLLDFENIGMTGFASLMPRMNDGQRGDLTDGIGSIVPVLTEAFRDQPGAQTEEQRDTDGRDRGDSDQVFRVL
jgi:hypothetical protein